ncbi:hypothetical protein [Limnoglobus roseus]|uniref:Zinc-ribbon domain-containing protein n=1 Tax=Limnoglobus roseus TaxID=2598579 RepID=A0A5C1A436_9BACT|nr:hypothetical protein [Limnoglobus roseus]QEL13839.1 zinc-ribbon domain-containing protein [Limnoglobus roseus]
MPRYDEDDDLPDGVYHDDEWQTVPCRYCRAEIAEGTEQCPKCGNYQSGEDAPPERRSWFIIVVMLLALACALFWAVGN